MIKTGLYRLEDLSARSALKGFFGGRRQPSIALYEEAFNLSDGNWWAEEILRNFSDARGVFKRTQSNRFDDFDLDVVNFINAKFSGHAIRLHDVGSSDARTSYDFMKAILCIMTDVTMVASDYCNSILIYESGGAKVAVDSDGVILEITRPPFVFNMVKHENFLLYPINFAVRELVARPAAKGVLADAGSGRLKPRQIRLVCGSAMELARTDKRFRIAEYDLLSPLSPGAYFHVVRAMNILNPSYFSEHQFSVIIKNVYLSLVEDGLFVVGSNQEKGSSMTGAVYSKHENRFIRASDLRCPPPYAEEIILRANH